MVLCNNIHGRSLVPISSLLLLFMVGSVRSHTYLSSLIINGNPLPEFDGLRPHPSRDKDYPLADVSMRPNGIYENDMTCGFLPEAARPANRKITVEAGSTIGLQWWHTTPGDEVVARTHHGPCLVYMAKSDTGAGKVWFKIWEKGYDASRGKWCTDDLIDARGVLSGITIPEDISPGNYLLRGEIIGLHDAHMRHGAQPFVHCAELTITGSGSANPDGVAIPGVYTDEDLYFNLYQSYNSYTIPGPAVYVPGSSPRQSTSSGSASTPRPSSSTTTGSSHSSRCPVSISQASISSWTEDGSLATLYDVTMTNVGSAPLDLKFRLSDNPTQIWNVVENNNDGNYMMPSWMHGALRQGESFHWGYIVRRTRPLSIQLVVPSCS